MNRTWRPRILKIVLFVLVGATVLTGVVMALWNALIPTLFAGVPSISFLQALGLLVLSRILFGGFRGRGGPGSMMRHRMAQLTDEERQQLMASGRGGRCHGRRRFDRNDANANAKAENAAA